jgi:hypothetical protein
LIKQRDMPSDRVEKLYEHELSSARDAIQLTKEYSLFVLRTCVVLNGGAILAILTLLSTLVSHPDAVIVVKFFYVKIALVLFAAGLVATLIAGIFGYHNFLWSQGRNTEGTVAGKFKRAMNRARLWATTSGILAVAFFVAGVVLVTVAIAEKQP